jgi:hypothetical protein
MHSLGWFCEDRASIVTVVALNWIILNLYSPLFSVSQIKEENMLAAFIHK